MLRGWREQIQDAANFLAEYKPENCMAATRALACKARSAGVTGAAAGAVVA